MEQSTTTIEYSNDVATLNNKKERSLLKTIGIKIGIFIAVLFSLIGFAFIFFSALLIKPNIGSNSNVELLNNPNLYYWKEDKFTTSGIVASIIICFIWIITITTCACYKKLNFTIGKKGSFTAILVFILIYASIVFIIGILGKPNLFSNLPVYETWKWKTILWEINIPQIETNPNPDLPEITIVSNETETIIQPTVVWWGTLIFSAVGCLIIVILFILFLIKFIFARSHKK